MKICRRLDLCYSLYSLRGTVVLFFVGHAIICEQFQRADRIVSQWSFFQVGFRWLEHEFHKCFFANPKVHSSVECSCILCVPILIYVNSMFLFVTIIFIVRILTLETVFCTVCVNVSTICRFN